MQRNFRQRRHLVEGRSVDAQGVDVGGDRVRIEAVGEHGARRLERERALAVADVEQHAALACFKDHLLYRALRGGWCIGKRPEGVGQDVARTQPREHVLIARRRMVDMDHQWHADLVRHFERDVERNDA
jgi:hypothetical protein